VLILVDEKDKIRRDKSWLPLLAFRKDVHSHGNKNYIHRSADFIVVNNKGGILLSQRSYAMDTYPGYVDIGGGHCGMLWYNKTLKKELKEEFGILPSSIQFIKKIIKVLLKTPIQRQYTPIFEVQLKKWTRIISDKKEIKGYKRYSPIQIFQWIIDEWLFLIPEQKIYLLHYFLKRNLIQDTTKIKSILQKQKKILKTQNIQITHFQIF